MSGKPLVKKEISPLPIARLIDEFGLTYNGEVKARIHAYLIELNNDSAARGHTIFSAKKACRLEQKGL